MVINVASSAWRSALGLKDGAELRREAIEDGVEVDHAGCAALMVERATVRVGIVGVRGQAPFDQQAVAMHPPAGSVGLPGGEK